jgi:hypothetical protein
VILKPLSAVEHRISNHMNRIPLILLLIALYYLILLTGLGSSNGPIRGNVDSGPGCYDVDDCFYKNIELRVFMKTGIRINGKAVWDARYR